jgi:5-methylcytosine-specific restriction enzyme subunit McrC
VLQREARDIVEYEATVVPELTDVEAVALEELGRELRGTDFRGGEDEANEGGGDTKSGESSVISVTRQPRDKGWRIQVRNAIGVIGVDDLQINVLPKIGRKHFNHVAAMAVDPGSLRFGRQAFRLEMDDTFLPAVWGAFLDAIELTLRADLHHDYEEHADEPSYIRGRLDIRRSSLNISRGILRFPSVFEELTIDNPVNRILKAASETVGFAAELLAPKDLGAPRDAHLRLASRAREVVYRIGDVGRLQPRDLDSPAPRLAAHQGQALELAKHILSGVGRSLSVGDVAVTCFLQPTPSLIESGIREILAVGLGDGVSVKKCRRTAARLEFNPDLVVEVATDNADEPRATGDVKYRLRKVDWQRDVLQQAVTFAQVFTAKKAFFIDFSDDHGATTETEVIREVEYHHVTWPCSSTVSPEQAEEHVLRELRRVLLVSPALSQQS